ncbi:MAG: MinD/ParA family protein [Negativicutes bacterium]
MPISPRIFPLAVRRTGEARIIAVTSGKGGVGKTNLTVNLAIALAQAGQRVIVIDADLGMANVDVVLGCVSKFHLMHLLENDISLNDVLIHGPYGVNYISGGSAIERAVELSALERQRLMDKLAACGEMADIILVDTGAGLGQNVLDFILAADEVLLVTTPEPTALTDAYAVMKAYSLHAANKNLRIIINRVYDETESRDVLTKLQRTAERFLQMPLEALGSVYEDRNVMNAVKRQSPLLAAYPNTLAARCVQAIAKNLLYGGHHEVQWGWRGFLQRMLKFKD